MGITSSHLEGISKIFSKSRSGDTKVLLSKFGGVYSSRSIAGKFLKFVKLAKPISRQDYYRAFRAIFRSEIQSSEMNALDEIYGSNPEVPLSRTTFQNIQNAADNKLAEIFENKSNAVQRLSENLSLAKNRLEKSGSRSASSLDGISKAVKQLDRSVEELSKTSKQLRTYYNRKDNMQASSRAKILNIYKKSRQQVREGQSSRRAALECIEGRFSESRNLGSKNYLKDTKIPEFETIHTQ